jgi:hypothetical protein
MAFLRTFDFEVEPGITIKIRELSFDDYFEFSATGKDLIDSGKATSKDWIMRQLELIARAIVDPVRLNGNSWTAEEVGKQFGKRTADRLYKKILEVSGLDMPKDRPDLGEDEATADTSLKKSAVA